MIYGHNQAEKSVLARIATRKMFVKPSQVAKRCTTTAKPYCVPGAPMQANHKEVSVTSKVHPTAGWTNLICRTSQNCHLQRQQGLESVSHLKND